MRFFNMAVAIDQNHAFKPFNQCQRSRLQSLTHLDYNNILLEQLTQTKLARSLKQAFQVGSFHRSFSTPCFSVAARVEEDLECTPAPAATTIANPRIEIVGGHVAPRLCALVVEVAIALASGVDPRPVQSGLGGAYILRSKNGDNIAVVKPTDEEPLAVNNPKGFGGLMLGQPGMRSSVRVGETGLRELAAYLLDHDGFAGVPPTALVKIAHVAFHVNNAPTMSAPPCKIASLQGYVDHDFDAGELGPSGFSVASVHRIGIFDVRLLNIDRHAGNILVKKDNQHDNYAIGAAELVPIDHGLCLPEWLDDPYFEWLHWPQASVPFSDYEYEYISNLDPFKDAELLRTQVPSLRESSIRVLVLCTIFLKRAAAAGLCLGNIGELMTRGFDGGAENLSVLENLCAKAKARATKISNSGCSDDNQSEQNRDHQSREGSEQPEVFPFENETEATSNDVLNLPLLLKCYPQTGKPPKIPRLSSVASMPGLKAAALSPLYEKKDHEDGDRKLIKENGSDDDGVDDSKLGSLTRSISYSVQNCNCETEGFTLGDMSADEWELFLETFEKLLPEVFEGTNCCKGLKKRLGTSCVF